MNIDNVNLTINISSGNAAFIDNPRHEVNVIVAQAMLKIHQKPDDFVNGNLFDSNGNNAGWFEFWIERDEGDDDEQT